MKIHEISWWLSLWWLKVGLKWLKNEIRGNITSYNTRYAMFPNFRFHPDRPRTTEPDNSKPNISKLLTGQTLIIKSYYRAFFLYAIKCTTLG